MHWSCWTGKQEPPSHQVQSYLWQTSQSVAGSPSITLQWSRNLELGGRLVLWCLSPSCIPGVFHLLLLQDMQQQVDKGTTRAGQWVTNLGTVGNRHGFEFSILLIETARAGRIVFTRLTVYLIVNRISTNRVTISL